MVPPCEMFTTQFCSGKTFAFNYFAEEIVLLFDFTFRNATLLAPSFNPVLIHNPAFKDQGQKQEFILELMILMID